MKIICSYCDKVATAFCIVEDGVVACDEHVISDYFRELEE